MRYWLRRSQLFSHTAFALLLVLLAACAGGPDWGGQIDQFEMEHVKYAQTVRWGQFDKAVTWIQQDAVEDFLKQAQKTNQIRFTDYSIIRKDLKREGWTAQILVRYELHRINELISLTVVETQHWKFNEESERWELNTNLFEVLQPMLHD